MTEAATTSAARDGDLETASRRAKPIWLLAGLGLLLAGLLVKSGLEAAMGAAAPEPQEQADTVPLVETVEAAPRGQRFNVIQDGFLRPVARIALSPEAPGRVAFVAENFSPGARFEEGAVLIKLDDREVRAQASQARADLASARAGLSRAKADAARQDRLLTAGATPAARAEQAEAELAAAEARLAQAQAALEVATERLEDSSIVAPFPALVQAEDVSLGQYVAPGQTLATIFDTTAAEVAVGLAAQDAAAVARAAAASDGPLTVRVLPTEASAMTTELTGEVAQIGAALDPAARTVGVTIRVPNAFSGEGAPVFAEDFVRVSIPARAEETLYAAPAAVVRKQAHVWTVSPRGTLSKVSVALVSEEDGGVVFSSAAPLEGRRLLLTPLTEESEGMAVRTEAAAATLASGDSEG